MNIAIFSTKEYDKAYLEDALHAHHTRYIDSALNLETVQLASGCNAVILFVSDHANEAVINQLARLGVKLIALRCAGYNNVDIKAANSHDIAVVRVPAYSPEAVAEHAAALLLALNRKIHKAYNRTREGNFSLSGLMGTTLKGKCVGIIGTGKIGEAFARIMIGFGTTVLAYDPHEKASFKQTGASYTTLSQLYKQADIISLHCPLNAKTCGLISADAIKQMKKGVMIINTSRGAILDAKAIIYALKTEHIGALGLDVYEQEDGLFFEDHSCEIIQDDTIERLLTFPNVIVTSHQGFFTHEAMLNIAQTTAQNIEAFERSEHLNRVN